MDLIKLVEDINQELYELVPEENKDLVSFMEEYSFLSLGSNGYSTNILFLGYPIWCSENDERPYENEDDPELCDYISLEIWIWEGIKRILSLMSQANIIKV